MCADSPERQCFYNLLKALYVNHPIKIDIAGTVDTIAEITPDLLYKCYYTFYNLHNMVLAIAGNVDEDKVMEICDKMLKPCENMELETKLPDEPENVAQKRYFRASLWVCHFSISASSASLMRAENFSKGRNSVSCASSAYWLVFATL